MLTPSALSNPVSQPRAGGAAGKESSGILWLASYPKSGNTWIRAFLANYLSQSTEPVPLNMLPFYCLGDNFVVHYEQLTGRKADTLSETDIHQLRPVLHRWFVRSRRTTPLVKTHSLNGTLNERPLITADATMGAIYVVRNPLDIVGSYAHHYQITADQAIDAMLHPGHILPGSDKVLPQVIGSWQQHVLSWNHQSDFPVCLLRYEDLRAKPQLWFRRLVDFMGLPVEPTKLQRSIKASSFASLARQEKTSGFVEARPGGKVNFFRRGQTGQWRDELTNAQIARLTDGLGPIMQKFGYDGAIR